MSVVSGIAGASAQSSGASKAASATKEAAQIQADVIREMLDRQEQYQQPYHEAGVEALGQISGIDPTGGAGGYLNKLQGLSGPDIGGLKKPKLKLDKFDFERFEPSFSYEFDPNDPGYQFQLEESRKAIDAAAAARGGYASRAAVNEIADQQRAITAGETSRQFERAKDIYGIEKDIYGTRYDVQKDIYDTEAGRRKDLYQAGLTGYGLDYQKAMDIYNTQYGKNVDLYNMAKDLGGSEYNKLVDLVKIGQGSAGAAGAGAGAAGEGISKAFGTMGSDLANIALQKGQNLAQTYSGASSNAINAIALAKMIWGK